MLYMVEPELLELVFSLRPLLPCQQFSQSESIFEVKFLAISHFFSPVLMKQTREYLNLVLNINKNV